MIDVQTPSPLSALSRSAATTFELGRPSLRTTCLANWIRARLHVVSRAAPARLATEKRPALVDQC